MTATTFETRLELTPDTLDEVIVDFEYDQDGTVNATMPAEVVPESDLSSTHLCIDGIRTALSDVPPEIALLISRRRYAIARKYAMTIDNAARLTVAEVNQRYWEIENAEHNADVRH